MQNNKIFVTEPAVPPLNEFITSLRSIWKSKVLTNNGPFHSMFEAELAKYLDIKHISLFSNGTLALMTALQALRIGGEVITTPFSFVATTHALWWNGIKPVFVDIEPHQLNLDPDKIEAAITPNTTAILPVHVYGNPCNVNKIETIADTYGLKVIYDAAHAFGVRERGKSILSFGDLSVLSFHATKTFNSIEGGAIISPDSKTKKRIDYLKNFGFSSETTVVAPGINGKMNEIQAAYGLLQLKYVSSYIAKRKAIVEAYTHALKDIPGITVIPVAADVTSTHPYFPILVDKDVYGISRDTLYNKLKKSNIFARRYFYPLISQFPTYRGLSSANNSNLPVASKIAKQILCLPLYPDLSKQNTTKIINVIKNVK